MTRLFSYLAIFIVLFLVACLVIAQVVTEEFIFNLSVWLDISGAENVADMLADFTLLVGIVIATVITLGVFFWRRRRRT